MPDQHAPGAGGVGPEWSQNFQQCLELLRGPGDERRFVGLLLVTRLLPQGSDDAVRRVLDALGTQFLHRLLLPLRRTPQVSELLSAEAAAHQITCCGLALAILAAACRLPDFASGPDVRELIPVLLQVVQYGGVTRVLQPGASASAGASTADAAAVSDALECLLGAAAAAPQQTCNTLEHLPVMEALAAWLTSAAAALTSAPPSPTDPAGAGAAASEAQMHNGTLLAAALLERLLAGSTSGGGGGGGRAIAVLAEHPAAAARIMAALAALVGNPRLRLPAAAAATTAPGPSAQPQPPPATSDSAGKDTGGGAATVAAGSSRGRGGAAQLQLESLHLLLLMLRACQEPAAAAAARELVRLDEQVAWSAAVRRGLGWLLRSRAPAALRHSALQLAALVTELVGEGWLLGGPTAAAGAAGAAVAAAAAVVEQEQERPGSFLMLLMETLKIETGLLLLQDALNPDRPVPALDPHRSYALGQAAVPPAPPAPSQRLLDELAARAAQRKAAEEAAVKAAVDAASAGSEPAAAQVQATDAGADAALTATAMEMEVEEEGRPAAGAAAASDSAAAAAAATMPAGQRALALLPACFRLLEGCVEAVAADAAAAEGRHMEMEVEGAGAGTRLASPPQPVLSDEMLQKLMASLEHIADTLLQFFEAAIEEQPQQRLEEPQQQQQQQNQDPLLAAAAASSAAAAAAAALSTAPCCGGGGDGVVLLGAARVLGRYLAEAPGAVRSGRVLAVLPRVMAVRRSGGALAGPQGPHGLEAGREEEEAEEEDLDSFALPFLLPGLLQATGPGADGRSETARALRACPPALDACVTYLAHCVKCAAAAAPRAKRLLAAAAAAGGATTGAGGASGAAALAALVRSERGMADVSMLLLNLLEPSVMGSLAAGQRRTEAAAAAVAGGTPTSAAWEVVRRCCQAGAGAVGGEGGQAAAAAAAAAAVHHPPLLAQLLPVCWLVQRWAAAREDALRALLCLDPLRLPAPGQGQGQGQGGDGTAATQLFLAQLGTRALLCTACLAAVALAAIMSRLAAAAATSGNDSPQQPQPQQAEPGTAAAAAAAAAVDVILPTAVVEGVSAAALAAAAAGASLETAQLHDAAAPEAPPPPPPPYGASSPQHLPPMLTLTLTPAALAEDFPGDGEVCWERLLGACAQLAEMSGAVRRLAVAPMGGAPGGGGSSGGGGTSWLQRLAAARARGEPAAEELLLSEVNLALLLQVVVANAP